MFAVVTYRFHVAGTPATLKVCFFMPGAVLAVVLFSLSKLRRLIVGRILFTLSLPTGFAGAVNVVAGAVGLIATVDGFGFPAIGNLDVWRYAEFIVGYLEGARRGRSGDERFKRAKCSEVGCSWCVDALPGYTDLAKL